MSAPTQDHRPLAWVTGAGGLIGSWLVRLAVAESCRWRVRPLLRSDLDLTQAGTVRRLFGEEKPALVIHCAALSNSAECQEKPALARKVNVEATSLLAELSAHIPFVFFSTDLVFDGEKGNYDESASVNPLSFYAETKVAAERIVLANQSHTVIRTSLNGGPAPVGDRGFDQQLLRAWQAGQTVRLYTDEFRSPIAAEVTAGALWDLIRKSRPGLYHLAGSERLSRWQIGQLLAATRPDLEARFEAVSIQDYKGAPRSPDSSLNSGKIQKLLGRPLPRWSEWLRLGSSLVHTKPG